MNVGLTQSLSENDLCFSLYLLGLSNEPIPHRGAIVGDNSARRLGLSAGSPPS